MTLVCDLYNAGFAHWAALVRSRKVRQAQRVLARQWHLVRLHANILCAWRSHAHKLQVTSKSVTVCIYHQGCCFAASTSSSALKFQPQSCCMMHASSKHTVSGIEAYLQSLWT